MNLTSRQIELIENSWDSVLLNNQEAGLAFYGKLFEIDSSLRRLFKEDIYAQSKELLSLITFIVHKLNNYNDIIQDIKALGERHKNYRVKPEYYTAVSSALLWTLEKCLGEKWDEEIGQAWIMMYTNLSEIMMTASAEKDSSPHIL
jgi:hemoglobin-like flavoprotein